MREHHTTYQLDVYKLRDCQCNLDFKLLHLCIYRLLLFYSFFCILISRRCVQLLVCSSFFFFETNGCVLLRQVEICLYRVDRLSAGLSPNWPPYASVLCTEMGLVRPKKEPHGASGPEIVRAPRQYCGEQCCFLDSKPKSFWPLISRWPRFHRNFLSEHDVLNIYRKYTSERLFHGESNKYDLNGILVSVQLCAYHLVQLCAYHLWMRLLKNLN